MTSKLCPMNNERLVKNYETYKAKKSLQDIFDVFDMCTFEAEIATRVPKIISAHQ